MKRFKKVYIEITNICNLSCNFCPKTKRPLEMMNEQRFMQIIERIRPYTDHVYFHLMGEPLLNPLLGRFLEICHRAGLQVNLTTNGTLLSANEAMLLNAPALRQVNLSLSSFEANDMTKPLAAYLQEVIHFVRAASEQAAGPICSIRLWNMDTETLKGSNQLNQAILTDLATGFDLTPDSLIDALMEKPSFKLRDRVYLNMAEKFEWPDPDKAALSDQVFCYGLRDQIGILVDGSVVPCCLDSEGSIRLGNLLDTPMADILDSTRAKALYDGFSNRKAAETLCQKCGYAQRY